ncbi:MAG TPA: Sec-independent protein translocase protein TatB [Chitinolyticbacter sp.]|nr:Sec-independent protein translocase protein TatB [Chitinolyticbacter sp.]
MFDVGFSELLMIGAVALVVLGPERLPKVARTVGALVGRARRFAANVKADLDREINQTELAKIEAELRAEQAALQHTIHQPFTEAREALSESIAPAPIETVAAPAATQPAQAESLPMVADASVPAIEEAPVRAVDERQLDLFAVPEPAVPTARDRR